MVLMSVYSVLVWTLTLSLVDVVASSSIKSNAVTRVNVANAIHTHRARRQAHTLTTSQISEIVDRHNDLRAMEGADNMELMTWNDFLASLATTWAAGCSFTHGQPTLGDEPPYTVIGQNLFAATGSGINLTAGVQQWYDEIADYDYDTLRCAADKDCGHYTQVVWSSSREVGCGYHLCPSLASSSLSNAYYLVCNYGPAGNVLGEKPYTKGPACSKCGSGAGWCKNGLCNMKQCTFYAICAGNCSSAGENCACAAICYNCATLNADTCRCSCADGWQAADCSVVCEDTDGRCNANPGWPPSWCNHTDFGASVRTGCPVMCRLCTPDASAVPGQCPPVSGNGTSYSPGPTISAALTTAPTATSTTASASARFARCQQATTTFATVILAFTGLSASVAV